MHFIPFIPSRKRVNSKPLAHYRCVLSEAVLESAAADMPASGAAALSEYLKTCEQHQIVPDVGGAFASAFASGFSLATSQAVVLPEPGAAIKEVMGLIEDLEREAADVGYGHGSQRLVNEKRAAIESKLRALPAQKLAIMPKGESAAAQLRAMATNYLSGHSWDKLDAKACIRGALEIEALRALVAGVSASSAQTMEALTKIVACIDTANAEGLDDALVNNTDARLTELVQRRLLPAFYTAIAAHADQPPSPRAQAVCTCPSGDGSLRWPCPAHLTDAVSAKVDTALESLAATSAVDASPTNPAMARACDLLSSAIGTLMGQRAKLGYTDNSPVASMVNEAVEFLRPWPEKMPLAAAAPALQVALDYPWRDRLLDGRTLERDAMGFAWHPELVLLDEGMKVKAFHAALGVEVQHTMAEDDLTMEDYDSMCNAENWSKWAPKPPNGEAWSLVAIFDSEDGPVAWWMRELPASAYCCPQRQAGADETHNTALIAWLSKHYLAADFQWGDPKTPVLVIEIPRTTSVCGDFRTDVIAAIAAAKGE